MIHSLTLRNLFGIKKQREVILKLTSLIVQSRVRTHLPGDVNCNGQPQTPVLSTGSSTEASNVHLHSQTTHSDNHLRS